MTDDERVAEILDAVLTWDDEREEATDAWHFEDFQNMQREAWTNLTCKVSNIVRGL
jgi:hypothetical protein